ncbi:MULTISPECIES: DUF6328 family protein [unclassified Actinotalea]|uniref:DUF6328 family protein n=1 Tax=unclassified Actinotalea TaxID=2638618 RepID=UPI001C70BF77|nr:MULTISPECIES: DUF6328 family protein [unclassified Actinotalea]
MTHRADDGSGATAPEAHPGPAHAPAPGPGEDGRRETPTEKLDRNWNEILQELRVTQTGIQILTGFLLTVPFQERFAELTDTQRTFYLVLVALAALTTGTVVAPVSLHRWLFRRRAKSELVTSADRFMRVGLVLLSLVVAGVVLLVFDVVTGRTTAVAVAGSVLVFLVLAWFALPAVLARSRPRAEPEALRPGTE